ncbi:hypothetical protein BDQ12DRAFT_668440 [Crucibulum laeve]|uniref:Uncharacterized protein n=1 Tax=Crucibulum laeve TaxID=68775 RepID=A0A5C3LUC0_9AGAR|nr:hypothetical protein BDQ12DRAFT_668440 [Crucibulum laeve]
MKSTTTHPNPFLNLDMHFYVGSTTSVNSFESQDEGDSEDITYWQNDCEDFSEISSGISLGGFTSSESGPSSFSSVYEVVSSLCGGVDTTYDKAQTHSSTLLVKEKFKKWIFHTKGVDNCNSSSFIITNLASHRNSKLSISLITLFPTPDNLPDPSRKDFPRMKSTLNLLKRDANKFKSTSDLKDASRIQSDPKLRPKELSGFMTQPGRSGYSKRFLHASSSAAQDLDDAVLEDSYFCYRVIRNRPNETAISAIMGAGAAP